MVTHLFPKRQEIAGFCMHVRGGKGAVEGAMVCYACTPVHIGTYICVHAWKPKVGVGYIFLHCSTVFGGTGYLTELSAFGFWLASKPLAPSCLPPSNGIADVCCQAGFLPRCLGSSGSHSKCFASWANPLARAFVHFFFRLVAVSTQFLDSLINCLKVTIIIFLIY